MLKNNDPATQITAAQWVVQLGPQAAAAKPALLAALKSNDGGVRQNAALALGKLGPSVAADAVPALTEALTDSETRVQQAAAMALGDFGSAASSAIPALEALSRQPDKCNAAPDALKKSAPDHEASAMCGRYVRRFDLSVYAAQFHFLLEQPTPPAYNIAPTDPADVVRVQGDTRRHTPMSWGFPPSWASDAKARQINARAETVHTSRMFKNAFENRRCLILGDGIIEWETIGKQKIPHLFTLKGDRPFAFAGIWNAAPVGQRSLDGCAIITTNANPLFARIHDRMPVVLQESAIATWLDPAADPAALRDCLVPFPAEEMTSITISPKVNDARCKAADCLTPTVAPVSIDLFADLT